MSATKPMNLKQWQELAAQMTATEWLELEGADWESPLIDIVDILTEWYGLRRPHLEVGAVIELAERHALRGAK